jgi:hypothetical protein
VQGYADRIPTDDASLDHVVSSLALHHVDDDGRTAFAREALRAIHPGGKITIVDFGGPASTDDGHSTRGHSNPGQGHGPNLLHAFRHLPSRVAQSPIVARNHGDGIVALLTEAGFGDTREVAHVDHRMGRITFVQATRPAS